LAALVIATKAIAGAAIDYEREDRWTREVVPSLVVGDAVFLTTPERAKVLAIVTEPQSVPRGSVILVHGQGVQPDYGVIGALRSGLADVGYETLSVQMPVLAADARREDYAATFPAAGKRIGAAIAYLRRRGASKIAIVSHSMGAAMTDAYFGATGAASIDAWVAVGMPVGFSASPREPVLDVVAEKDLPAVSAAALKRVPVLPKDGCSRQMIFAGADHYFETPAQQRSLADAINSFLDRVFAGRC
jgi:hypothetical protein